MKQCDPHGKCRDCGTTEGMGWWVDRMKHPGAAGSRCHLCYLAYTRRRQSGTRAGTKPRLIGHGSRRCVPCSIEYNTKRRSESHGRRLRAEAAGDRSIHWLPLGERDGWKCHLCGCKVPKVAGTAKNMDGATVDHLVPLAQGGEHVWENVALAHRRCNLSRGDRGLAQLRLVG